MRESCSRIRKSGAAVLVNPLCRIRFRSFLMSKVGGLAGRVKGVGARWGFDWACSDFGSSVVGGGWIAITGVSGSSSEG